MTDPKYMADLALREKKSRDYEQYLKHKQNENIRKNLRLRHMREALHNFPQQLQEPYPGY